MPKIDTPLHLNMLRKGKAARSLSVRMRQAIKALVGRENIYGLEWGDPDSLPPLEYVRDHFLSPYVSSDSTIVEIGPGGGRWTRYMLGAKRIFAVDYHQELLDELRKNLAHDNRRNVVYVKNNGDDFPGIPVNSIDFVFSFGAFVHLDMDIIDRYLKNMVSLLRPQANAVIHYSDKTKPVAQRNVSFSDNDPERMRELVHSHGYSIYEEDVKTMWHSSIIRFGLAAPATVEDPTEAKHNVSQSAR